MDHIVSEATDVADLIGGTFSTEHFGPFTIENANQAPELNAIAYTGRDVEQNYLFMAFAPYGKALKG
jgi:hypothetical protein